MPLAEANTQPNKIFERHSSIKNTKAWLFGWLPVALGLGTWIIAPLDLSEWFNPVKVFGFFAACALSVTVHELAHFYVATVFGLKPWCIRIGHGDIVFDKQFQSFRLVLKSLPYSGAVYPFLPGTRARKLAVVWAGPISNAVLLLIFINIASRSGESLDLDFIPTQMLVANGIILMWSLVPHYTKTGPNDAMLILELLRGKPFQGRPASSATNDLSPSWSWMVKQVPPDNFLQQCREQLKHPNLSPDQRCLVLDAFVTCVLMYGAADHLAEADQYSEELLRLKPDEWTVKGTRGSILVEKGDLQAGIVMLEAVMAHDSNTFDRAISSSFLALAHFKGNNRTEAVRWLAISRQIDPDCASMLRIAALLNSTTQVSNA